jgi:hypothetical protein
MPSPARYSDATETLIFPRKWRVVDVVSEPPFLVLEAAP